MNALEHLRLGLAEIEAELDRLAGVRGSLIDLIAFVEGDTPTVPVDPDKAKTLKARPVDCPECGRTCGSKAGLAMHRKHAHDVEPGSRTPGPITAKAAVNGGGVNRDMERPSTVNGKVFVCSDCDSELSSLALLAGHVLDAHHRGDLFKVERVPQESTT